jgi:hypothetical protein
MMPVGYGQDDVVFSELASYLVSDTLRTFNFYRLTCSARSLNGAYQSLEVSARFGHWGPYDANFKSYQTLSALENPEGARWISCCKLGGGGGGFNREGASMRSWATSPSINRATTSQGLLNKERS